MRGYDTLTNYLDILGEPYESFENEKIFERYHHPISELKAYLEYLEKEGCTLVAFDNDRLRSYRPAKLSTEEQKELTIKKLQDIAWLIEDTNNLITQLQEEKKMVEEFLQGKPE